MNRALLCRAAAVVVLFAASACSPSLGECPPEFVGDWVSMRKGYLWRMTLKANGRFTARPDDPQAGPKTEGEWGVKDGKISWSYTDSESRIKTVLSGADESKVIVKSEKDTFEVIEKDGTKTTFSRPKPASASKPAAPTGLPDVLAPSEPAPEFSEESIEAPPE